MEDKDKALQAIQSFIAKIVAEDEVSLNFAGGVVKVNLSDNQTEESKPDLSHKIESDRTLIIKNNDTYELMTESELVELAEDSINYDAVLDMTCDRLSVVKKSENVPDFLVFYSVKEFLDYIVTENDRLEIVGMHIQALGLVLENACSYTYNINDLV